MEFEHAELVQRLAKTPVWLRAALSAANDRATGAEADDWGVADIVNHVRAADAIFSTRVFHILVREGAPLPAFDEREWGKLLAATAIPIDDQLAAFALRRAEMVAVLRSLGGEQWRMSGVHELLGPVTVAAVCEGIAEHESEHRAQLDGIAR